MDRIFAMALLFHAACVKGFLEDPLSYTDMDNPNLLYLNSRPLNQLSIRQSDDVPAKKSDASYARNFMRFGRGDVFKEPEEYGMYEDYDYARPTRSGTTINNSDRFVRFGRSKSDFLRFGRESSKYPRTARDKSSFVRFGRGSITAEKDRKKREIKRSGGGSTFVRFGRNGNFMRFGRPSEEVAPTAAEMSRAMQRHSERQPVRPEINTLLSDVEKGRLLHLLAEMVAINGNRLKEKAL